MVLFLLENEDGKYANLVAQGKNKAIKQINGDKKLQEELEPILAKERFAQIIMDITYDVTGPKEEKFSKVSFELVSFCNELLVNSSADMIKLGWAKAVCACVLKVIIIIREKKARNGARTK